MTKKMVNLVTPLVLQNVEEILDSYPHHPYRQAFAIPDLRQKLICYVLSRLPGMYITIDETTDESSSSSAMAASVNQNGQIQNLIREGIQQITFEYSDWISHHIPNTTDPQLAPSTWFG